METKHAFKDKWSFWRFLCLFNQQMILNYDPFLQGDLYSEVVFKHKFDYM